ncbi:MAG: DUF523 domain-containing protein [Eubacteriaceae bacterium]|nr:DUF523 domain-containing protein [Eubacteriaceae bacterium]
MYLISACLLGKNTKYDGGNNYNEAVVRFSEEHSFMIVCPEAISGLPVPRPPAERVGDKVIDREGKDVTLNFQAGSAASLEKALAEAEKRGETIEGAILKANSPSCGSGIIYDGTFSKTTVSGDGCFTALLKDLGIKVITEKEINENGKF